MNTRIAATFVLIPFLVYSLWVASGYGALGFLALAGREPWAMQMLLDLVIALAFTCGWLVRDARALGRRAWPFVVGTVLFGSIAPLLYVATRPSREPREAARAPLAAAAR